MLTILNDPAGITGRHYFLIDYGRTLQDNIRLAMPGGGADCTLIINGQTVDPLTDPRLDIPPGFADIICIIQRPAGGELLLYYALAAVLVVASLALMPKQPGEQVQQDSPNNRLTGQSNIARTYQAIPDVYGLRRVWPDLIQASFVEYIDHVKNITEWLCVSRGKGTITDVQFADTPLPDIQGATYQISEPASSPSAYPELNTTTLSNVYETFACPDVNGQEMGSVASPEVIERTGTLSDNGTNLTIKFTDESAWANLKSLAPSGYAYVTFSYATFASGGGYGYVGSDLQVLSYSVAGGDVTFVFDYPILADADPSPQATVVRINGGATTTTAIGPFTLPTQSDRIHWNVAFLRGLKGSVNIKAEWWKIDSAGAEIGGTRQNQTFTYTADTYDQRFYTQKVTPSAGLGTYRVTLSRLTADLGNGADVAKLEALYAVRYYATKTLPGVTVIRVTTQATEQATGIKDRRFNLRWNRHVRTLTTTTLSASRNFARAMAHLWCVAGENIGELDTTTLAAINTALGETSSLLRFDGTLDDADMSLGERLQRIAYTARCAVWRDGSKWTVTREQERTTPDLQLDYRNLAASGDSVINYAAHLPASHNGVEVEYTDETTQASKAYVRLNVASGAVVVSVPTNPVKIKLPGCATTAQATNRANLEARRLLYQRTTVSDTALQDASALGLGSLVRWIDPNDFAGDDGLQAGEVMTIAGSLITTSEPLDWRGETTGRMLFTGIDGLPLGSPIVVTPHVSGGATLASVPGGLFLRDAARQCGSRYSFGPGLSAAEIEAAGLYVATRVAPNGDGTVSIALANYDARMFDAD
jgi:hypothetical protein